MANESDIVGGALDDIRSVAEPVDWLSSTLVNEALAAVQTPAFAKDPASVDCLPGLEWADFSPRSISASESQRIANTRSGTEPSQPRADEAPLARTDAQPSFGLLIGESRVPDTADSPAVTLSVGNGLVQSDTQGSAERGAPAPPPVPSPPFIEHARPGVQLGIEPGLLGGPSQATTSNAVAPQVTTTQVAGQSSSGDVLRSHVPKPSSQPEKKRGRGAPRKHPKPASSNTGVDVRREGIGKRSTASNHVLTAEEKRKVRAERNRESAEKSRLRRKKYTDDLEREVGNLREVNKDLRVRTVSLMETLRKVDQDIHQCVQRGGAHATDARNGGASLKAAIAALDNVKQQCPMTFGDTVDRPEIPSHGRK